LKYYYQYYAVESTLVVYTWGDRYLM